MYIFVRKQPLYNKLVGHLIYIFVGPSLKLVTKETCIVIFSKYRSSSVIRTFPSVKDPTKLSANIYFHFELDGKIFTVRA